MKGKNIEVKQIDMKQADRKKTGWANEDFRNSEITQKREKEKAMLGCMVKLYCKGKHGKEYKSRKGLCEECQKLREYAFIRTERCPFMETKTFCSACKVHCYSKEMQERVREVMKYSGPRMLLHHPVMAVRHMWITIQNKKGKEAKHE